MPCQLRSLRGFYLVSGKPHVSKMGSLAVALSATMSIPGAFSPVARRKAVYVTADSGNAATDVVRAMGAEIVHCRAPERRSSTPRHQSVFSG